MRHLSFPALALLATGLAIIAGTAVKAAPTTSNGQISVAQVIEMVDLSKVDASARNAVIAYLAGVGEATGLLFAEGRNHGSTFNCSQTINLSEEVAVAALNAAAPDRSAWAETPATPIIIADMFARGGCK